jgi:hypothetical protein
MATGNIEASDVFGLGGNFIAQNASGSIDKLHAKMKKADGDYEKFSTVFNEQTNQSAVYSFNADTGLGAALPSIGEIKNGYVITEIGVDSAFDTYPVITVTGHKHKDNTDIQTNLYAVSVAMQALMTGAVGAYDLLGLATGTDSCVTGSTYSIGVNHIDDACGDGGHWFGTSIEGMETINVTYIGFTAFTEDLVSDYTITNYTFDDSNEAHDVSSATGEKLVVRT